MCGPPDFGALFEAATRIVLTIGVLAGTAAVYSLRQEISSLVTRLFRLRT